MISIDLSERTHKKHTGNPKQCLRPNSVQDKIWDKFFFAKNLSQTGFYLGLNFVSDWILSRTEYCLGFCLGIHTAVVFRMQSFNCYLF